jgi:ribosomal protein S18 acetylase RimI-like enzyme
MAGFLFHEVRPEPRESAVNLRLDGPDRTAQRTSHVLVRQAVDVAKDDGCTLRRGAAEQALRPPRSLLTAKSGRVRAIGGIGDWVEAGRQQWREANGPRTTRTSSATIPRQVDDDARQPRPDPELPDPLRPPGGQRPVGADERVLGHLLCVSWISKQPQRDGVQPILVCSNEGFERAVKIGRQVPHQGVVVHALSRTRLDRFWLHHRATGVAAPAAPVGAQPQRCWSVGRSWWVGRVRAHATIGRSWTAASGSTGVSAVGPAGTRPDPAAPAPCLPGVPDVHPPVAAPIRVDRALLRRLATHEARLQAAVGRELLDLGDGWLLTDAHDPEPYWNRLVAPDWPVESAAFDRRLDQVVTVFAARGRLPHVWPLPSDNRPADLEDRLRSVGFETMGVDILMVLADPAPAAAVLARPLPRGVSVERLHGLSSGTVRGAGAAADVLVDAFEVGDDRRTSIELETLAALEGSSLHVSLVHLDGRPAAVAKRSSAESISYLSSVGTRRDARRRGLGELATAVVVRDAVAVGSEVTYLKVDADNGVAQRLYRRLGFVPVAGRISDLLLRR